MIIREQKIWDKKNKCIDDLLFDWGLDILAGNSLKLTEQRIILEKNVIVSVLKNSSFAQFPTIAIVFCVLRQKCTIFYLLDWFVSDITRGIYSLSSLEENGLQLH